VKLAIGPPIENLLLRLRVPRCPQSTSSGSRPRCKELEGRRGRAGDLAGGGPGRFGRKRTVQGRLVDSARDISLYAGRLHRSLPGPHLQDSKPIKAVKLTGLAGAYWRGDEKNALTRIYGTAFYTRTTWRAPRRVEEARARPPCARAQLDLFHLEDNARLPFWHPKEMVIWNILEDLRRRENAKRGYSR
jgi:hypothetical protein